MAPFLIDLLRASNFFAAEEIFVNDRPSEHENAASYAARRTVKTDSV
jgi:hypothetical protein